MPVRLSVLRDVSHGCFSTKADDAALRQRLRELAGQRRRFGYRRLSYLLAREGFNPNYKKLFRLYQE